MILKGLPELKKNIESFKREVVDVLYKTLFHGLTLIQNEAKLNHEKGAHALGRFESKSTNLTQSTQALEPKILGKKIKGTVIAGMNYAEKVELGSAKSRPYPFLFPAFEHNEPIIMKELEEIIKKIKWVN